MMVKYLQNTTDRHGSIYRVNFATKKYALVACDIDMGIVPNICGSFGPNGFKHGECDIFREVANPLQ